MLATSVLLLSATAISVAAYRVRRRLVNVEARCERDWLAARVTLQCDQVATEAGGTNPRSLRLCRGPVTVALFVGDTLDPKQFAECVRCDVSLDSPLPRSLLERAATQLVHGTSFVFRDGAFRLEFPHDQVTMERLLATVTEAETVGERWHAAVTLDAGSAYR